jgi:hypothetical protein
MEHEEIQLLIDELLANPPRVREMAKRQLLENFIRHREIVRSPGGQRSAWQARTASMKAIESMLPELLKYGADEGEDESDREVPMFSGAADAEPWEGDAAPEEDAGVDGMVETSVELHDGGGPPYKEGDLLDEGREG